MLNFLQISLTSRCNFTCWHCPMADYRNTDDPEYVLTNARLLPWVFKHITPRSWIIELTGGEPALYPGINELCAALDSRGYSVLVKTNGSLPINAYPNVRRIAAFHHLEEPPRYFDEILIVDGVDSDAKISYCTQNAIPFKVVGFNDANPDNASHRFQLCAFMDPHGHPTACKARQVHYTSPPDKYALEYTGLRATACCPHCKAAIDAWRFLPESWKI